MSAQNPFQIPSCFKLDIEQRRRERFKKTVVTSVIVSIAVVVGLLIEGCVSERSEVTPLPAQTAAQAAAPESASVPATKPAPAQPAISQSTLPTQPCPVAMEKTATPVATPHATGGAVYLVKSGDSLTRIAKNHGVSLKALKAANHLDSDRIVVGESLKIPSA
jgi:LysM repeat protein